MLQIALDRRTCKINTHSTQARVRSRIYCPTGAAFRRDKPFPDLPPRNAAAFGVALDAHMLIKDMQGCFPGLSIRRPAASSGVPALPPCRFVIHINESNQASNQIRASASFIFLFSARACDSAALITEMHINGETGIDVPFKVL